MGSLWSRLVDFPSSSNLIRYQMASGRLPSLLALEVENADRPSADWQRDSWVDPPHLPREPSVECASNSIGTAPTRVQCDRKDRGEISGETRQASFTVLEDISCQSCESVPNLFQDSPLAKW